MTTEEITERLEDAKTEIAGRRLENAWQLLDRLIRDIQHEGIGADEYA